MLMRAVDKAREEEGSDEVNMFTDIYMNMFHCAFNIFVAKCMCN